MCASVPLLCLKSVCNYWQRLISFSLWSGLKDLFYKLVTFCVETWHLYKSNCFLNVSRDVWIFFFSCSHFHFGHFSCYLWFVLLWGQNKFQRCPHNTEFWENCSCRREALRVYHDCNLSFWSCSLATDQQLVAAGGIRWANETQQLMFSWCNPGIKWVSASSVAQQSLLFSYLLRSSACGRMYIDSTAQTVQLLSPQALLAALTCHLQ